jgi:hypothetical protein
MALKRTSLIVGFAALLTQTVFGALEPTVLPVYFGQYGGGVAVGAQNTLVTWIDYRRTEDLAHEIYGTRVGPLGELLDGDGIPLTGLADGQAAVAALRDQFLVVWAKGPNIYARRMTGDGQLLDTQPIVVSAKPNHPYPDLVYLELSAASDGVNFWVAWTDDRSMPAGTPEYQRSDFQDIYAARISPSGRVLDPRGIKVCVRRGKQTNPRLSARADFIVWSDYRGGRNSLFGARLNPRGVVLDYAGFQIASSASAFLTAADVAGNDRGWLVAWGDGTSIQGAKVLRTGGVSVPFAIAQVPERSAPRAQTAGQDFLVLWQAGASTMGTRVTASKQVRRQVTIATDPTGANYYSLGGFAGNGSRFCVTGATAPQTASWLYNDTWFGVFTSSLLP